MGIPLATAEVPNWVLETFYSAGVQLIPRDREGENSRAWWEYEAVVDAAGCSSLKRMLPLGNDQESAYWAELPAVVAPVNGISDLASSIASYLNVRLGTLSN